MPRRFFKDLGGDLRREVGASAGVAGARGGGESVAVGEIFLRRERDGSRDRIQASSFSKRLLRNRLTLYPLQALQGYQIRESGRSEV